MIKEIGVGIFYHNISRNYLPTLINIINRIKDENKKEIKVYILSTNRKDFDFNTDVEIETIVFPFDGSMNYRNKLLYLINCPHKYSITISEDFLMNNHIFDFLIENRKILNNKLIAHITGITQIGVPSCEYFIDSFCTQQEKNEIYQLFLQTDMNFVAQKWNNPEVSKLNKFTLNASEWDFNNFHEELSKLDTIFKGIHPVRFNYKAQILLSEIVINNIDKFMKKYDYEIFTPNICHHCNDMSFHNNEILKKVEQKYKLDPDEEVALSRYKRNFNLQFKFINFAYVYTELFAFNYYQVPKLELENKRKEIETKLTTSINQYFKNN